MTQSPAKQGDSVNTVLDGLEVHAIQTAPASIIGPARSKPFAGRRR